MTRTFDMIVTRPLMFCAVAVATGLLAGPASASVLIHASEDQNLCFNDPYQNTSNGTQLVVTPHCYNGDGASNMDLGYEQGYQEVVVMPGSDKCMDNLYGVQQEFNPIVVWECNRGETQKWDYVDGVFHYHPNPAMCASIAISANPADYAGSGSLVLAHCNGQGNQKFVLTAIPSFDFSNFGGNPHAACGHKLCGRGGCICIDD